MIAEMGGNKDEDDKIKKNKPPPYNLTTLQPRVTTLQQGVRLLDHALDLLGGLGH